MSEVVALLEELVAIDSVSSRSNAPMIDRLRRFLERRGFSVRIHRYRDDAGVEKENLVALAGPATTPAGAGGLALLGHTDTVPYDPAWTDALRLTESEGRLYGRGAADTKGFIAAALVAIDRVDLGRLCRPLICIFTADEEVGCVGAKRLIEEIEVRPAHAIVGEPTGLVPIRSHKGYWLGRFEVRGREGHSSHPSVGRSAIFDACSVLGRVRAIGAELEADADRSFDPPHTTLNVGTIEGGKAANVIPGHCTFPLEWRPLPEQPGGLVVSMVERELASLREADPGLDVRFEVERTEPAAATPSDAPIVRFLEEVTGHRSATVPFGTELPYVNELGALGCVCGPGDIRTAHRTGEYVERAELERAVEIYRRAIERFCCE